MTSQAFIWAEAVAKSCENSVLICRLSSTCTQQKRITDRLGILCFEHHKVVFDISFAIPKAHPQHDVLCTALLSPTSSSCSILLHFNSTIPVLMLLLFLAGCSPQFPEQMVCQWFPSTPNLLCPVITSAVATATCLTSGCALWRAISWSLQLPSQLLLVKLLLFRQSLPRQAYLLRPLGRF